MNQTSSQEQTKHLRPSGHPDFEPEVVAEELAPKVDAEPGDEAFGPQVRDAVKAAFVWLNDDYLELAADHMGDVEWPDSTTTEYAIYQYLNIMDEQYAIALEEQGFPQVVTDRRFAVAELELIVENSDVPMLIGREQRLTEHLTDEEIDLIGL